MKGEKNRMTNPSSKLPNLTKDTEEFLNYLESLDNKPLYELSPQEARDFLRNLQAETYQNIEASVEELFINDVRTFIIRPDHNNTKLPVVLYLHGGGWVMGDEYVFDNLIKKISICSNTAVVFPEYTRAPEAQYPTQINEVYSVLNYIYDHADELNFDKNKIAIMGDSAGGNMAAVTTMKAMEENGPKIKFQLLIYPVTNADMDTDSYHNFKDGPWLTKKAMEYFWDAYAPDKNLRQNKYVSPLYAELEDLKGMPTTLIITDENDVLCDEGEAFSRKLDNAGVDVINVRINGTHHDFIMLNALSETEPAKGTLKMICSVLKSELR